MCVSLLLGPLNHLFGMVHTHGSPCIDSHPLKCLAPSWSVCLVLVWHMLLFGLNPSFHHQIIHISEDSSKVVCVSIDILALPDAQPDLKLLWRRRRDVCHRCDLGLSIRKNVHPEAQIAAWVQCSIGLGEWSILNGLLLEGRPGVGEVAILEVNLSGPYKGVLPDSMVLHQVKL